MTDARCDRSGEIVVRLARSAAERTLCFALRRRVFMEEQGISEADEFDGRDAECRHFLALLARGSQRPVAAGTARLWVSPAGAAHAQRVAVDRRYRGRNIGRALMAALEREAAGAGHGTLHLAAQVSAVPFYERLGYRASGPLFDDAGIPHRRMKKNLGAGR